MQASNFNLPDQNGDIHTLADYEGKWLVVYFYPKDDTPGCTKEACGFRDQTKEYNKRNIEVLGISKDPIASHKNFAEKYNLSFTILSDPTKSTIKLYGAWGPKKFMGRTFDGVLRKTFLIDPSGEIKKTYDKVDPLVHAQQILEDVDSFTP